MRASHSLISLLFGRHNFAANVFINVAITFDNETRVYRSTHCGNSAMQQQLQRISMAIFSTLKNTPFALSAMYSLYCAIGSFNYAPARPRIAV